MNKHNSLRGCVICRSTEFSAKYDVLVECRNCGHVFADPKRFAVDATEIYDRDYFEGGEYASYEGEEDVLRLNFARRIATIAGILPKPERNRLFEVGCAYGFFLDEAASFFSAVGGIDVSKAAVDIAHRRFGDDVTCGNYLAHEVGEPKPDVICMWDVIEHLESPEKFVSKATDDLRKGGLLALTTGDIGSLNARVRGRRWRLIHPPSHLHYFSKRGITTLLHQNGIEVVSITYPPIVRTLRMIFGRILGDPTCERPPLRWLADSRVLDIGVSMNLFDIMFVVGRKK